MKKNIIIIGVTIAVSVALIMGVALYDAYQKDQVGSAALKYARNECFQTYKKSICENLEVDVKDLEWGPDNWLVHIYSPDSSEFSASLFVEFNLSGARVIEYHQNR